MRCCWICEQSDSPGRLEREARKPRARWAHQECLEVAKPMLDDFAYFTTHFIWEEERRKVAAG
jgi:hypothetical protein